MKKHHAFKTISQWFQIFTLVELLVVIAIIAILAAMLLPALSNARMAGQSAKCRSNQKTIATSIIMYSDDFNGMIIPCISGAYASDFASSKWYTNLLVNGNYLPNTGWTYSTQAYGDIRTGVWRCPSAKKLKHGGGYAVNRTYLIGDTSGSSAISPWPTMGKLKHSSEYWMLGDARSDVLDSTIIFINCDSWAPISPFPSSRHNRSANAAMFDGHVEQVQYDRLKAAGQINAIGRLFCTPACR